MSYDYLVIKTQEGGTDDFVTVSDERWLYEKYFDEYSLQLRTSWDLYIKFYTAFLTMNIAALGLTVQYIETDRRWPLVLLFVLQNFTSLLTAINMSYFTRRTEENIKALTLEIARKPIHKFSILSRSPVPGDLGFWAGWGNAFGLVMFIFCWLAVLRVKGPTVQPTYTQLPRGTGNVQSIIFSPADTSSHPVRQSARNDAQKGSSSNSQSRN